MLHPAPPAARQQMAGWLAIGQSMLPAGFFCHACGLSLACVSWRTPFVRRRARRKVQGVANPVISNLGKTLIHPDANEISGIVA
jgi:hypothetical protein